MLGSNLRCFEGLVEDTRVDFRSYLYLIVSFGYCCIVSFGFWND